MIEYPEGEREENQPLEISCRRTIRSLLTRIMQLYEAIYAKYGEDGLELIEAVSREYGSAIGKRVRGDKPPLKTEDTGRFFIKLFNNIYTDGIVESFGPERVSIKVYRCPYPFNSKSICRAHTEMEVALVQYLNPNLDYCIEKSIPNGDDHCLHVIESSLR